MLSQKFPFTYFNNMLTPRKMFAGRKAYSWWQVIILILFLNALVLMPVSYHYASQKSYDMGRIVDKGLDAITEDTFHVLQAGKITDGQFSGESQLVESKTASIAILPDKATVKQLEQAKTYRLIVEPTKMRFLYPAGQSQEVVLTGNHDLSSLTSLKEVKTFINQQWYNSHRVEVFMFLMMVYVAVLYLGTILVLFGGAGTLLLSRKAGIFSLHSFKECLGLLLNCFGIPSLLALMVGLMGWVQNPILIMNVQVFGTLLILMLVLYRTGFRDDTKK